MKLLRYTAEEDAAEAADITKQDEDLIYKNMVNGTEMTSSKFEKANLAMANGDKSLGVPAAAATRKNVLKAEGLLDPVGLYNLYSVAA